MKMRKLVFVLVFLSAGTLFGGVKAFSGLAGTENWSDAGNWDPVGAPDASDDVTIAGGTVRAKGPIEVSSLTVTDGSKVYFSADELTDYSVFETVDKTLDAHRTSATVVRIANDFTVEGGSVVYPEAAILTGVPVVFRVGGDFSLAADSSFNTRQRGWGWSTGAWADRPSDYCKPFQYGTPNIEANNWTLAIGSGLNYGAGARYGGTAAGTTWQGRSYAKSYGPTFAPLFSGSPGGGYTSVANARGSGSIVVLAEGEATIDGVMDADGAKKSKKDACAYSAPSGGGIWLAADSFTFGANALLTAGGGDSQDGGSAHKAGGGGRIAIAEGCSEEEIKKLYAGEFPSGLLEAAEISAVAVNVIGGLDGNGAQNAPAGTLSYVRPATLPVKMRVKFFGAGTVSYDGVTYDASFEVKVPPMTDLQLTATPAEGSEFAAWFGGILPGKMSYASTLTVNSADPFDLSVTFRPAGEGSRVWTGAVSSEWGEPGNWEPAGTPFTGDDVRLTDATVTAEGDCRMKSLTVAGASKVTFHALPFDGESTEANLYAHASVVRATGAIVVDGTSVVTFANDPVTGAAVRFDCASFLLGAGATLTATEQGWFWYEGADDPYRRFTQLTAYQTRAMGPGNSYTQGGGYGAKGGKSSSGYGLEYGFKYAPFLPGSPNGLYSSLGNGNRPGGTVWIKCDGLCELYGTVSADGRGKTAGMYGAASGGGVWICAKGLKAAPTTSVTAIGGYLSGNYSSHGSGGRVSLALGCTDEQLDALATGEVPPGVTIADGIDLFAASVRGGEKNSQPPTYGNPGTVTTVTGPLGFINVTITGSPKPALGVDPANGVEAFEGGTTQLFTAPEYGVDPSDPSIRYPCLGYVVTDADGEVKRGPGRSVEVEIANPPLTVTWQWGAAQSRTMVRKPEHGTLLQGGVPVDGDAIQWPSGVMTAVEVVPDDGYEFVCWEGNVPFGAARANPLAAKVSEPLDLTPVLRPVAAATLRTWKDGAVGDWKTAANWEPEGIPGADDALVVASGAVTFSNALSASSLTVSGGTVKVATAGNVNGEITVAGDVRLTDGSIELGYGSTWRSVSGGLEIAITPNMPGRTLLSVGGDLALGGAATLAVHAGPIVGDYTFATGCSFVEVAGALTMDGTAQLLPYSDYKTGGSVKITAGSVSVGPEAKIDAKGKGYNWLDGDTPPDAPGTGFDYTVGGSHGGRGYGNTEDSVYDFPMAPTMPGSPSGSYSGVGMMPGGGVIRIHAKSISVDGTLDAEAEKQGPYGGAAGGSIWLTADAFAFGKNAVLTVRGGTVPTAYSSYGGGGLIALGLKLDDAWIAELAETGTWTGFRSKRAKDEAAFRSELGNETMTINIEWGGGDTAPAAEGRGAFTFVDGRLPGLIIKVK